MISIIEDLSSIIPKTYKIRLNYVDEKDEGLSIIEHNVIYDDSAELERLNKIIKSEVQFYITNKSGKLYNKSLCDMLDIYDTLCGRVYSELGDKYILDIQGGQIANLGRLEGFDAVSMDVVITYKIIK